MNIFQSGDKYELAYSSCPRAGMVAGYVEIISVDRIAESDMQFNPTSIKGCFDALAGEITYIVYSDSTNTKKKKPRLFVAVVVKSTRTAIVTAFLNPNGSRPQKETIILYLLTVERLIEQ